MYVCIEKLTVTTMRMQCLFNACQYDCEWVGVCVNAKRFNVSHPKQFHSYIALTVWHFVTLILSLLLFLFLHMCMCICNSVGFFARQQISLLS